jgi:hypothetical protein
MSSHDTLLLNHVSSGKTLEEIARIQKKPVTSIQSRLKTIAARLYFKENLSYEKVEEITGIKKEEIIVKRSRASEMPKVNLESESESEPISLVIPIQIISTENPFTLDAISTLLISSLTRGLLTTSIS